MCAKEFQAISFCSGSVGADGATIRNRSALLAPGASGPGNVTMPRKAVAAGS